MQSDSGVWLEWGPSDAQPKHLQPYEIILSCSEDCLNEVSSAAEVLFYVDAWQFWIRVSDFGTFGKSMIKKIK